MAATAAQLADRRNGNKTDGSRPGGALERVTVNLTPRSARALELATQITGDSKTDTINRAIQLYAYIEHITSEGGTVHIRESADSEPERLKFFLPAPRRSRQRADASQSGRLSRHGRGGNQAANRQVHLHEQPGVSRPEDRRC